MTVWAASGPSSSAEDAEELLCRSVRAVFGTDNYDEHVEWITGHGANFRHWESQGTFEKSQEFMRRNLMAFAFGTDFEQACLRVREETIANTVESVDVINKKYLEKWGHRLEAVRGPDGSMEFLYNQTLSDEEISQKKENMVLRLGAALWGDDSAAGRALLNFLNSVYQAGSGKRLENANDVSRVWLALLNLAEAHAEPRLLKRFEEISVPWIAQLPDSGDER